MKVDYWTERDKWPYAPPSHLFFPEFFEQVGQAIFPDEWSGHETRDPPVQPELPSPTKVFEGDTDIVSDLPLYRRYHLRARELLGHSMERPVNNTLTQQEWSAARDRWYEIDIRAPKCSERRSAVRRLIQDGASAGTLEFVTRKPDGGPFRGIQKDHWNCDRGVADVRFSKCSMTHRIADAMRSPPSGQSERADYFRGFTLPLFIERKNALWAIPHLTAWHRDELDELPEYKKQAKPVQLVPMAPEASPPAEAANDSASSADNLPSVEAIQAFAAKLDAEGLAKRKVDLDEIARRWDMSDGSLPKVESVRSEMKGQRRGRRKKTAG